MFPLVLATIAAVGVTALPAPLLVSDALQGLSIGKATHFGTGCPQSTTDFSVTADGNNIISHFPAFPVNPASQSSSSIFCGVIVPIACAPGQQFSVVGTTYHDQLDIGNDDTGSHIMTYYFQSSPTNVAETRHDFDGAINGGVQATDTVPGGQRVWSACGGQATLVVNNRGFVSGGAGGTSLFNVGDAVTGLEWRNC